MSPYEVVAALARRALTATRLHPRRAAAAVALVALAACGGNGGGSTSPGGGCTPGGTRVCVKDNFYSPDKLTVATGTTVTWQWAGSAQHSVTFDQGTTSPTQSSGTFQLTFPSAGTYAYHCLVHGLSMSGQVVVQ